LFHVDNRPASLCRFVEGLVELADMRLPIIGVFSLGIGVMDDPHEAGAAAVGGVSQHLQVTVRIAESEDWLAADEPVDPDRLAAAIDELDEL
jgi:hypothetical protein